MKCYLIATGILFGVMAAMHLVRAVSERSLLATQPGYYVGMAALGILAGALSVWAWCLLRAKSRP